MTEREDPRIPKPRRLPRSLQGPEDTTADPLPAPPPEPKVSADLVKYLEHHFPEKAHVPEQTCNERLWLDMGTRLLALHLIGLAKRLKDSV